MLRRLSILGSLLLAACVPQVPQVMPTAYYNKVATKAEANAWRAAQRLNTANAYRTFINSYPRSRYVPMAIERLSVIVKKSPSVVRVLSGSGGGSGGTSSSGGRSGY